MYCAIFRGVAVLTIWSQASPVSLQLPALPALMPLVGFSPLPTVTHKHDPSESPALPSLTRQTTIHSIHCPVEKRQAFARKKKKTLYYGMALIKNAKSKKMKEKINIKNKTLYLALISPHLSLFTK